MLGLTRCTSVLLLLICDLSFTVVKSDEKLTKMKFSMPKLTEEETESNYLPDDLRCDACLALIYQIKNVLRTAEQRNIKKTLRESDVIDVLDNLCIDGFEEYGLKEVNGAHRLSGPGLEGRDVAGMVQMGGKWPRRIRDMCQTQIGEIGEMEIYDAFRENENFRDLLCENYCSSSENKKLKLEF